VSRRAHFLENIMFFTLTVGLPDGGYCEFATESLFKLLELAQQFGNTDIEEVEDEELFEIPRARSSASFSLCE